eukprot:scaffold5406_cov63-Phaeocystis_antarctica.AAC.2
MSSFPSPSASNCAKSGPIWYLPFAPFLAGRMPPLALPLSLPLAGVDAALTAFPGEAEGSRVSGAGVDAAQPMPAERCSNSQTTDRP